MLRMTFSAKHRGGTKAPPYYKNIQSATTQCDKIGTEYEV